MQLPHILIIDEEIEAGKQAQAYLGKYGYQTVTVVESGEKAFEFLSKIKPDLVLMDIVNQKDQENTKVAEIISSDYLIPIVYLTSYLEEKRLDEMHITKPFGYVLKPIQEKDLVMTVQAALYAAESDKKRRETENALKESELLYRSFVENFQGIAYKGNLKFTPLFFHGKVEEITGYSETEFTSGNPRWDQVIHEDDLPQIRADNKFIRSIPFTTERTYRIFRKDGEIRWVKEYLQNICDENDKPIYLNGVIHDITDQKIAEESLRASEQRYRDLFEKSKDAILFIENGKFVDCNQATVAMLGYEKKEDFLFKHPSDLSPEKQADGKESWKKAEEMIKTAIENGSHRFEWEHIKADGEIFPVEVLLTTINYHNGKQLVHTVWRDITERKKAEAALKDSEEKYRNVVEFAIEAICVLRDDKFLYFNPETVNLFEYSSEEMEHLVVRDTVLPEDRDYLDSIRKRREDGESPIGYSIRIITKNGSVKWVSIRTVEITWEEEKALLVFIRDITERKRAEEIVIQTEKMNSLGELSAGIAHELNNPLSGILTGVQNIFRRLSPEFEPNLDAAKEAGIDLQSLQKYFKKRKIDYFLNGIMESGLKASEIITNMLHFSRKSDSYWTLVDIRDLIDKTLELAGKDYKHDKGYDFRSIKIIKEFDQTAPPVPCKSTEIEQVILNLLINSAWALSNSKTDREPAITVRTKHEKKQICIEVEDNGPGMNEETRKRIFEPFYTTKPTGEGTGLGLSVSYTIIANNHFGSLEVESQFGIGTKFLIKLPLQH